MEDRWPRQFHHHHFQCWELSASTTRHHSRRPAPQAALRPEIFSHPAYRTSPEGDIAYPLTRVPPYPPAMSSSAPAATIPGAWSLDPPHSGNVAAPRIG